MRYSAIVGIEKKITMNKRTKSNSIRIIGGRWRGHRLPVLDSNGLRPTTDRVRETLFNWLMADIDGASCLDAFAGSGALGLECLSRGAHFVQFVESKHPVAKALQAHFQTLQLKQESVDLAVLNTVEFLARSANRKFDLVFLDPPFEADCIPTILSLLLDNQWLTDDALIYIERPSSAPDLTLPPRLESYRQGKAGQSCYGLYSLSGSI